MIEIVSSIPSTNAALLARFGEGFAIGEGQWLVADRQTAGRGRAGRQWNDGAGNFMGSTVVHLRAGDPPAPTLALMAGVATHAALAAVAPGLGALRLKWPNDVLVDQAKLAGILLERQGDAVVVGIGVNLANHPDLPDRATIALGDLGFSCSRDDFATTLGAHFAACLARWHAGDWPGLRMEWLARGLAPGTAVTMAHARQGRLTGGFAGLTADGAAMVRLGDGRCEVVHAGDVELVAMGEG